MAAPLVSDELWALVAPLIPPERPKPKGGRPPIEGRAALTGILFVLKSGIPWEMLPAEMGCGPGQCKRAGKKGGQETGPSPTDQGRPGTKRHILTDAGGIPLALTLSPANVHDSQCLERVIDAVPPIHRPAATGACQASRGQGL